MRRAVALSLLFGFLILNIADVCTGCSGEGEEGEEGGEEAADEAADDGGGEDGDGGEGDEGEEGGEEEDPFDCSQPRARCGGKPIYCENDGAMCKNLCEKYKFQTTCSGKIFGECQDAGSGPLCCCVYEPA